MPKASCPDGWVAKVTFSHEDDDSWASAHKWYKVQCVLNPLNIRRVLRRGRRGGDVRRWQQFLRKQQLLNLRSVDGEFGPVTFTATRNWQKRKSLVVDGVVGPATLRRAGEILVGSESLSGVGRLGLGADYGSTTSDGAVEFGRGCDPRGMPTGTELMLVRDLLALEAERSRHLVTCDGNSDSIGRGMCRAGVNTRYSELMGEVQDELAALCATREITMGPTLDEPGDEPPPVVDAEQSDSTWIYVGGIVGVIVIGAGAYYLTRKRK